MELSRNEIEVDLVRYAKILLIGPAKEGKTQSFATMYDVLKASGAPPNVRMYDLDEGAESLIREAREKGWSKHLRVYRYRRKGGTKISKGATPQRSLDEFLDFIEDINKLYDEVNIATGQWKDLSTAPGLILVDGITALKDAIYDFVLKSRGKEIGGSQGTGITFDEQNMFKAKMREVINACGDLPCHMGMTAHVEVRQEMSKSGSNDIDPTPTGNSYVVPIIFGDLRWMLTSLFDAVLYTDMSSGYKWRTRPNARIKGAGVRTTKQLPELIDQDFKIIFDAIMKHPVPKNVTASPAAVSMPQPIIAPGEPKPNTSVG